MSTPYGPGTVRTAGDGSIRISYVLVRKTVKNVNLRVRADGTVAVSAPRGVPAAFIDSFVLSRAGRIAGAVARRQEAERREGGELRVLGRPCVPVFAEGGPAGGYSLSGDGGTLTVAVAAGAGSKARDGALAAAVRAVCESEVRAAAERLWPSFEGRVARFPELRFRRMRSQWGNCRPDLNRLTFSTALAGVPRECIELVVAHEFAHLIHPDHSPAFYAELGKAVPDRQERQRMLRNYSPTQLLF